jgi:hypothetical protein
MYLHSLKAKTIRLHMCYVLFAGLLLGALRRYWDIERSKETPRYQRRQGRVYPAPA